MSENKFFIVSTPIGNLGDFTFRGVETLKNCDFILCEDTRVTQTLLKKFEIPHKELISFNAANEIAKIDLVIKKIKEGLIGTLVSDAGTPLISDPGARLVSNLLSNGIEPVAVPGPSAAIAALSISGFPTDSFVYEGFLPSKKGRQKKLKELAEEARTIVLYESVYRIEKLLAELSEYMPERSIAVCKELTKMFEETWRGRPGEILSSLEEKTIKGEFVVIVSPKHWLEKSERN